MNKTAWKTVPKPSMSSFWKPNYGNLVFSFFNFEVSLVFRKLISGIFIGFCSPLFCFESSIAWCDRWRLWWNGLSSYGAWSWRASLTTRWHAGPKRHAKLTSVVVTKSPMPSIDIAPRIFHRQRKTKVIMSYSLHLFKWLFLWALQVRMAPWATKRLKKVLYSG